MASPTQRSLKQLRDEGWTVAITEHWNSHMRIRQDMFGFVDLFAVKEGEAPLLLQVTASGTSSRVKKILGIPAARTCLLVGMRIQVVGWRKLRVPNTPKAKYWAPKIREIYISDFDDSDLPDPVDDKKNPTG